MKISLFLLGSLFAWFFVNSFSYLSDKNLMKTNVYAIFTLMMSTVILATYAYLIDYYSDATPMLNKISGLEEEVKRQKLRVVVANLKSNEFRTSVASLLPGVLLKEGTKSYQLRKLASVTQSQSADVYRTMQADIVFGKGKRAFREKKYAEANVFFKKIIDVYSYSVHTNEAYFLLVEGSFQQNHIDECVRLIQEMVVQYPETELTGYALLRLAKIFEFQDRPEEAANIYQTVLRTFPQRGLASQARMSFKRIGK